MELEEAIKVLKNMDIRYEGESTCKECIFDNNKKCYDENGDCQMKAIETVLQELESYRERYKLAIEQNVKDYKNSIPKKKIEDILQNKFIAVFDGEIEINDNKTEIKTTKYIKANDLQELLEDKK